MRISDWSSDVCSSDLQDGARRLGGGGDRALGACRPPGDGSWLQGSQRFPGGRRRSAASLRSHRRLDGPGASAPAAGCTARSEEHTSELQSLMRISYAVFCLKKKKKQSTN